MEKIKHKKQESVRHYIHAIFQDRVLVLGIVIGLALLLFMIVSLWEDILLPQFYLYSRWSSIISELAF